MSCALCPVSCTTDDRRCSITITGCRRQRSAPTGPCMLVQYVECLPVVDLERRVGTDLRTTAAPRMPPSLAQSRPSLPFMRNKKNSDSCNTGTVTLYNNHQTCVYFVLLLNRSINSSLSSGDSVSLPRRPPRADAVVPAGGDKPGPPSPAAPLGPSLGLPGCHVRDPAGACRSFYISFGLCL